MQKVNLWNKISKEYIHLQEKQQFFSNLKQNWFFPVSAMAFYYLTMRVSWGYLLGLPIAFIIMIIVAGQMSPIKQIIKDYTPLEKILSFLTAAGICLENQKFFYSQMTDIALKLKLPEIYEKIFLYTSYIGIVLSLYFIFTLVLFFYKKLKQIIIENNLFNDITKKEIIIYSLLLITSLGYMIFSFIQSQAFYGTEFICDIIYTSDSPALIKQNVYLLLTHPENDIRQPLFALFAAPFMGGITLISKLFTNTPDIQAILLNSIQIFVLFFTNFLLTKTMKLDSQKRIYFMILISCTYPQLLFKLMMEQYIFSYFWLILCIYIITEKKNSVNIPLMGASNTLVTSMVLLPFTSNKSPIKDLKNWFVEIVKYPLEFILLLLAFCRFDVIFYLASRMSFLYGFSGKAISFSEKIKQYTHFIYNCFFSPDAGVDITTFGHTSWQLNLATTINYIGIAILLLSVISLICNKDKKSSLLAGIWVGFSIIMLLGLGWGTKENGLILYTLYFGWAFFILLFQLIEKVEEKLNIKFLLPTLVCITTCILLINNIPAIKELLDFAILYYPI